jgi:hypothetical protein
VRETDNAPQEEGGEQLTPATNLGTGERAHRGRVPVWIWTFVAYLLICLVLQAATGAWRAPFTSYPDEPAHFVGGVMFHDYLTSGLKAAPKAFAENYYRHYPYFGVGIWPPLFYAIAAVWYLIVGVGRWQALLVVGVMTAGASSVVCALARKRAGLVAGLSAGLLFLSLPQVQRWTCAVMAENVVAFFCLAAAALSVRYFERTDLRSALGFGLCAACAILTKYTAWFLIVLPFAALVAMRRFDLLRRMSLWAQLLVIAALIGPWTIWTANLIARIPGSPIVSLTGRLSAFSVECFRLFPPVLAAVVVVGLAALALRPSAWRADVVVLAFLVLGQISFLSIAPPAGAEDRYLIGAAASLLVLSFAGWKAILDPVARHGGAWRKLFPRSAWPWPFPSPPRTSATIRGRRGTPFGLL